MVIQNGTIVTPLGKLRAGIAVDEGKIVLIRNEQHLPAADHIFDAEGKFILPGAIDAHVHIKDPINGAASGIETYASGTAAAAVGGITTVLLMPTTIPPIMDANTLQDQIVRIKHDSYVNFGLYGCACISNLTHFKELARAGVVAFKSYMPSGVLHSVSDDTSLYRVFEKIADTKLTSCVHAENSSIITYLTDKYSRERRDDPLAHAESRPNFAEEQAISTALIFSRVLNTKLHISHMSTREGVHLIETAKAAGRKVSAETCPQYLLLTAEEAARRGSRVRINPPLRSSQDVDELWRGIRDGTVDIIASDHAPHTKQEKETGFEKWATSSGMPEMETMLSLMLTRVNEGKILLEDIARTMSESVAKIFGLYPKKGALQVGSDADFTIVDMTKEKIIKAEEMRTEGREFAVYDGWRVKGIPVATIVNGALIMAEGEIVGKQGTGTLASPNLI